MKESKGSVEGYKNVSVPFTLVSKEADSKNLVVFLPGAAYTVQSPAFHYSQKIFFR